MVEFPETRINFNTNSYPVIKFKERIVQIRYDKTEILNCTIRRMEEDLGPFHIDSLRLLGYSMADLRGNGRISPLGDFLRIDFMLRINVTYANYASKKKFFKNYNRHFFFCTHFLKSVLFGRLAEPPPSISLYYLRILQYFQCCTLT